MKAMDNCILIDWFAVTFKDGRSVFDIIDLLKMSADCEFVETYGFYGYKNRLSFDKISILFNHWDKEHDYPMLEMSGQGCRDFETYGSGDWNSLFNLAINADICNMSRLDVAYDDKDGLLDIRKIVKCTQRRSFVSRSNKAMITNSITGERDGLSVMLGSRSSEFYLRIYDKEAERGRTGEHWVRAEIVMKHERATSFLRKMLDGTSIGTLYRGVIHNYLRFVVPDSSDCNKWRWKMCAWWEKFLDNVEKISIYVKKDVEYNLSRVAQYVFHQAGNCIDTYIKCLGINKFLESIKKRDTHLAPHHKRIINEFIAGLTNDVQHRNSAPTV